MIFRFGHNRPENKMAGKSYIKRSDNEFQGKRLRSTHVIHGGGKMMEWTRLQSILPNNIQRRSTGVHKISTILSNKSTW